MVDESGVSRVKSRMLYPTESYQLAKNNGGGLTSIQPTNSRVLLDDSLGGGLGVQLAYRGGCTIPSRASVNGLQETGELLGFEGERVKCPGPVVGRWAYMPALVHFGVVWLQEKLMAKALTDPYHHPSSKSLTTPNRSIVIKQAMPKRPHPESSHISIHHQQSPQSGPVHSAKQTTLPPNRIDAMSSNNGFSSNISVGVRKAAQLSSSSIVAEWAVIT
ncbi:hypothetical protein B7494_g1580 [Chlorociboria aeruginascens]|nr:hypothetical protein B7494_g1580 [Chlorociboria aeruginascens]